MANVLYRISSPAWIGGNYIDASFRNPKLMSIPDTFDPAPDWESTTETEWALTGDGVERKFTLEGLGTTDTANLTVDVDGAEITRSEYQLVKLPSEIQIVFPEPPAGGGETHVWTGVADGILDYFRLTPHGIGSIPSFVVTVDDVVTVPDSLTEADGEVTQVVFADPPTEGAVIKVVGTRVAAAITVTLDTTPCEPISLDPLVLDLSH